MVKNGYLNQNVIQLKQITQLCISQIIDTELEKEPITYNDVYQFNQFQNMYANLDSLELSLHFPDQLYQSSST
ncbi:unnamed protein product (macronuclear) [Paramecium tetraurelia]|uniref:Uncharacterized protein n=1 Tax=Paramecium tetraurelia TaxID=5888 RepID=A0BYF8_PARTE|nr:uncharacterized protein GSPATT00033428001 [Paramecium tetraurelia]CAK63575.1 unnamed protein product [Paramecium tetraurelia]|eukprot:XP_001430973.1 hypothetical protein (macronuclear) [Paramecium tetraurelia strain d4-2]